MNTFGRIFVRRLIACVCACLPLTNCVVVDHFSDRATTYNREAELVQDREILLNIIRASLRRPMQFTGLQTVTGSAQVSSTPSLSVPFGGHRPLTALSPNSLSLAGTMSGGPQFTVPILETQEFYQGILKPLSLQLFDFYFQQGFPKEILVNLFVSKIVVTQDVGGVTYMRTYRNDPGDNVAFDQFQMLVEYLLNSGLSTETVSSTTTIGPPIPKSDLVPTSTTTATDIIRTYTTASQAGLDIANDTDTTYRIQKRKSDFRFCFGAIGTSAPPWLGTDIDTSLLCGHRNDPAKSSDQKSGGKNPQAAAAQNNVEEGDVASETGTSRISGVVLSRHLLDALDTIGHPASSDGSVEPFNEPIKRNANGNAAVTLHMYVRSTEAVMYYLGEITRRNLEPDRDLRQNRRVFQVKTHLPFGSLPSGPCSTDIDTPLTHDEAKLEWLDGHTDARASYNCANIFYLEKSGDSSFLSVDYNGATYRIPDDPEKAGRTYQVLELVKQLFALNTSAKEFPATNVLSVITAPQ